LCSIRAETGFTEISRPPRSRPNPVDKDATFRMQLKLISHLMHRVPMLGRIDNNYEHLLTA
jgi:hypothetical protein